jgi:hypothetical protein
MRGRWSRHRVDSPSRRKETRVIHTDGAPTIVSGTAAALAAAAERRRAEVVAEAERITETAAVENFAKRAAGESWPQLSEDARDGYRRAGRLFFGYGA